MARTYFEIAESILDCACQALAEQEEPWEGTCCVHPGQVAFDSCCEDGGQAWARVVKVFPTARFPMQDSSADPSTCQTAWSIELEIGVLRCVCFDMCDCEVTQENARKVYGDAEAVLRGIQCCFEGGFCGGLDYRISEQTIIGPEGGCGGSKVTLFVRHQVCCN